MSQVLRFLALVVSGTLSAVAAPEIAVVQVSRVFQEYHAADSARTAIETERQKTQNDPRLAALRSLAEELKDMATKLSDGSLNESTRAELLRRYQIKQQEFQSLQEDFRNFQEALNKELNARLVREMKSMLVEIREQASRLGAERGYDWVIDVSGNSNTGVPFVLYVKDAPDLTEDLLQELNRDAPVPAE